MGRRSLRVSSDVEKAVETWEQAGSFFFLARMDQDTDLGSNITMDL
jgi:hypothetical protein